MSATTYAARPRGLSFETQAKVDKAKAHLARRDLIRSIREGLAQIIDIGERDWTARKQASCASDAEPSRMLLTAHEIAAAFDLLTVELGHD